MKPPLHKGQLTTWKDDRGFGFIKPDQDSTTVFLHISALKGAGRRPKVGDTILYEQRVESGGKIRAARASIQGVAPQPLSTKRQKSKGGFKRPKRKGGLLEAVVCAVIFAVIALVSRQPARSRFSSPTSSNSPTQSISRQECDIKGNISFNTNRKLYHLPGMEDYASTTIDRLKGEKWFCSESDAIADGWQKAPR